MEERILIVDDNHETADTLASIFSTFGCETKAVYDGEQAISEVAKFAPDMILLDIGMPGLNGYETVSRIRQQRDSAYTIVIAVSGWSRDEDKVQAYAAGFDLHVAKPIDPRKIKDMLKLLLPSEGDA